jgi:hypothetical protein
VLEVSAGGRIVALLARKPPETDKRSGETPCIIQRLEERNFLFVQGACRHLVTLCGDSIGQIIQGQRQIPLATQRPP